MAGGSGDRQVLHDPVTDTDLAINPAGALSAAVSSDKVVVTPASSHNTVTEKVLVAAAGAGVKNKVQALNFSTLIDTACTVQLLDGSAGTVIFEIELQASIVPGISKSIGVIPYCETAANTALYIDLGTAQKVTYSLTVVQEA